ncbi:MAG: exodeoxyribonuclease III [Tissierellia bacterium]|nr:exodeoxyribonuclease III [Tissierellia bacterium]
MKLVTWNVNGLRAVMKKNFMEYFNEVDADIFCLQEIKLQEGQIEMDIPNYKEYWNYAEKKGYSGTAVFSKEQADSVNLGLGEYLDDNEGRVITADYGDFYLVNVYTPNSQRELARLDYRMHWEDKFREYVMALDKIKPVIICGDLNVAHQEIDLHSPKTNTKNPGFSPQEREKMTTLLNSGFNDSFRTLYPDKTESYTWWSYITRARSRNAGWRIDYFVVSERFMPNVKDCVLRNDILGSDHCPVELILK